MYQQLGLSEDTRINVCLMWDYLHYLDLQTLEVLSAILQPQLAKGARGYGFGCLRGKQPDDTSHYGIANIEHLATQPVTQQSRYFAHSQQDLGEHFPALHISRATLLREGRLELLLEGV